MKQPITTPLFRLKFIQFIQVIESWRNNGPKYITDFFMLNKRDTLNFREKFIKIYIRESDVTSEAALLVATLG